MARSSGTWTCVGIIRSLGRFACWKWFLRLDKTRKRKSPRRLRQAARAFLWGICWTESLPSRASSRWRSISHHNSLLLYKRPLDQVVTRLAHTRRNGQAEAVEHFAGLVEHAWAA